MACRRLCGVAPGHAFSATGREVWHEMAWVLVGLLVFEPILASWVGRSR